MSLPVSRSSGRRGSNPRPSAWKADALPTELHPRTQQPIRAPTQPPDTSSQWWRKDSNLRRLTPADLQSAPFSHSGTPPDPTLALVEQTTPQSGRDGKFE